MTKIVVAGGGLVGPLLSIMLRKHGHEVTLLEKRSDPRKEVLDGGRSINLVLTSRGINALYSVGLARQALDISVAVTGRMMHAKDGELTYQPYGRDPSECNYSISRLDLNKFLLTEAEKLGVKTVFSAEVESIDLEQKNLTFKGSTSKMNLQYDILFGSDGAGSKVREFIQKNCSDFKISNEFIPSGYKELTMPLRADKSPPLRKDALHIWPRGSHMLMALANLDGSFTMTLYMPHKGPEKSFEALNSTQKVQDYFSREFSDVIDLMPGLLDEYEQNPVGSLGTVRCSPWVFGSSVCLLGDAAHAIVPFFGQGMNCGFEDCAYLSLFLEKYNMDWHQVLAEFENFQRPNANAIATMALENFIEMQRKVGDENFLKRKGVEAILEKEFPTLYRSRYGLVTYTLVPYVACQAIGLIQEKILEELCAELDRPENVDLKKAEALIQERLVPFYKNHGVSVERFQF